MRHYIIGFMAFIIALDLTANPVELNKSDFKRVKDALVSAIPDLGVVGGSYTSIGGVYKVTLDNDSVIYVDKDGSDFLVGSHYKVTKKGVINITERSLKEDRARDINTLMPSAITYRAIGTEKSSVTVFTDVTCGYCKKFHSEIPALNKAGVTVNYLAFPRSGKGSDGYLTMEKVWCSEDKNESLNLAIEGGTILAKKCKSPIDKHYLAGTKLGVSGTPTMVRKNGELMVGYKSAKKLIAVLGLGDS